MRSIFSNNHLNNLRTIYILLKLIIISLFCCISVQSVEVHYNSDEGAASILEKYKLDDSTDFREDTIIGSMDVSQSREVKGLGSNSVYQKLSGSKGYSVENKVDALGAISAQSTVFVSDNNLDLCQNLVGEGNIGFVLYGQQDDDYSLQKANIDQGTLDSSQHILAGHSVLIDQSTTLSGADGQVKGVANYQDRFVSTRSSFSDSGTLSTDLSSSATGRVDLDGFVNLGGQNLALSIDATEGDVQSSYDVNVKDGGRDYEETLSGSIMAHAGSPKITHGDFMITGDLIDMQGTAFNPQGQYNSSCTLKDIPTPYNSSSTMSVDLLGLEDIWVHQGNYISRTNPILHAAKSNDRRLYVEDRLWVEGTDYTISGHIIQASDFLKLYQILDIGGICTPFGVNLIGNTYVDEKGWLVTKGSVNGQLLFGDFEGEQKIYQTPNGGYIKQSLRKSESTNRAIFTSLNIDSCGKGLSGLPGRPYSERPYSSSSMISGSGLFILDEVNSIASTTWNNHETERTKSSINIDEGNVLLATNTNGADLISEASYQGEKAKSNASLYFLAGSSYASAETAKSASAEVELNGDCIRSDLMTLTYDKYGEIKSGLECMPTSISREYSYKDDANAEYMNTNFVPDQQDFNNNNNFQAHLTSYTYPHNDHHSSDEYLSYASAGVCDIGSDVEFKSWDTCNSKWDYEEKSSEITPTRIYRANNMFIEDNSGNWNDYQKSMIWALPKRAVKCEDYYNAHPELLRPSNLGYVPWGIDYVHDFNNEDNYPKGGQGIDIAVIDTGVDSLHPDLVMRVEDWCDYLEPGEYQNHINNDPHGHGTHVAGILVADGGIDRQGILGMAPESDLIVYKVRNTKDADTGNYSLNRDDIVDGIYRATDLGAEIISLSYGGKNYYYGGLDLNKYFHGDEMKAIAYAKAHDVMIVASAGNVDNKSDHIKFPACLDDVIAVGAINKENKNASYTLPGFNNNDGIIRAQEVMFGSPGGEYGRGLNFEIFSTMPTYQDRITDDGNNYIKYYDGLVGTSMACPHISGLAAKYWSEEYQRNPLCDPERILALMKLRVDNIPPEGDDPWTGLGAPRYEPLT